MAKRKHGLVVKRAPDAGAAASSQVAEASEPPESAEPVTVAPAGGGGRKKKRRAVAKAAVAGKAEVSALPRAEEEAHTKGSGLSDLPAGFGAGDTFDWLCAPLGSKQFIEEYWEKKPLHLKRQQPNYYGDLFSKDIFEKHLSSGTHIAYGDRLNLARFDDKLQKKVMMNPGPRGTAASLKDVKAAWVAGASIQVMHPQQFHEPVWRLLASLERCFSALFGANSYITPGEQQGFAPHYDDVEVFMLQVEGSKRWRLYEPPAGNEFPLPREYSRDFIQNELGTPVVDVLLEAGDMLYLPRGYVHQGVVEDASTFSHHLTVSTYQKNAWCQFIERVLSSATEKAAESSVEFRQGLPLGFLRYMGSWHDGVDGGNGGGGATASSSKATRGGHAAARAAFVRTFQGLLRRLQEFVDLDEICDELGVEFMHQRLPPPPLVAEGAERNQAAVGLTPDSRVRWADASAQRAMLSTDPETSEPTIMLFHSRDNDMSQHMSGKHLAEAEEEVGCLRFEAAVFLPALRALLALPGGESLRCGDLPLQDDEDKVSLCENLLEAGLLEIAPAPAAGKA